MDSTKRFSSRVENYVKYRPSYPVAAVEFLLHECDVPDGGTVADLGSGTGILSVLLLDRGLRVFGVEPNKEMREVGERLLAAYPNFISTDGTAENTTLPDASVDLVTAGQAFHWFDVECAQTECKRILKPGGCVALIWNSRQVDGTPFAHAYEQLLRTYSDDYARVNHQDTVTDAAIIAFFGTNWRKVVFASHQLFDFDGLSGRLMSSSYAPEPSNPKHAPMLAELRRIFDAHQQDGRISFDYDTELYVGRV